MNTNSRKILLCIALFSCLVVSVSAVTYGMLFIASNSVHVDVQYEVPKNPHLTVDLSNQDLDAGADKVMRYIKKYL